LCESKKMAGAWAFRTRQRRQRISSIAIRRASQHAAPSSGGSEVEK